MKKGKAMFVGWELVDSENLFSSHRAQFQVYGDSRLPDGIQVWSPFLRSMHIETPEFPSYFDWVRMKWAVHGLIK